MLLTDRDRDRTGARTGAQGQRHRGAGTAGQGTEGQGRAGKLLADVI